MRAASHSGSAREHPGRPPPPPLPESRRALQPLSARSLGGPAVAFCRCGCCSSSWPKEGEEASRAPAPSAGRAGRAGGRSTCRLGGPADAGDALPAEARSPEAAAGYKGAARAERRRI